MSNHSQQRVTVIVCTRNRAADLRMWLPDVIRSALYAQADVLVVDNGSTDDTLPYLRSLGEAVRVVVEPVVGLTHARRRAVVETISDVLVFVDDDVEVAPSWAADMAAPILAGDTDCVAGRIRLADDLVRPWLTPSLRMMLAEYDDHGQEPVMVGASYAVARCVVDAVDWDDEVGPGALGMSDDVLFSLVAKARGFRIQWASGRPVIHHPAAERLTRAAFAELASKNGRSHAYLWRHWLGSDLGLSRVREAVACARYVAYRAVAGRAAEMDDAQYEQLRRISFYRQLRVERRRPRRYPSCVPEK